MITIGYTHYYYVDKHLDPEGFENVVTDFRKLLPVFEKMGIQLRNWEGHPDKGPEVNTELIAFNGNRECGHEGRNLGIAWPGDNAKGVGFSYERGESAKHPTIVTILQNAGWSGAEIVRDGKKVEADSEGEELRANDSDVDGTWFAGCKLKTRTCGGDCSHESFVLNKDYEPCDWEKPIKGKWFRFTKTAYKPYDFAVNCALIIAKHHLGDQIEVQSDGGLNHWADAMALCQAGLGYGLDFEFDKD